MKINLRSLVGLLAAFHACGDCLRSPPTGCSVPVRANSGRCHSHTYHQVAAGRGAYAHTHSGPGGGQEYNHGIRQWLRRIVRRLGQTSWGLPRLASRLTACEASSVQITLHEFTGRFAAITTATRSLPRDPLVRHLSDRLSKPPKLKRKHCGPWPRTGYPAPMRLTRCPRVRPTLW